MQAVEKLDSGVTIAGVVGGEEKRANR